MPQIATENLFKIKFHEKLIKFFLLLLLAGIVFIVFANYTVESSSEKFLFDEAKNIPECKTALVLGTGKFLNNGAENPYFFYRIDAAEELYKSGKIKTLS